MELQSVMMICRQIEAEENYLAAMQAQATAPSTSKLTDLPRSKATASRVENFGVLILDSSRRLENLRVAEAEAILDLTVAILERIQSRLPREVLLARYVDLLEFKAIAQRLNYSESMIYRYHRSGLKMWQNDDSASEKANKS